MGAIIAGRAARANEAAAERSARWTRVVSDGDSRRQGRTLSDRPTAPGPELGEHEGLAYARFDPDGAPRGGVVIVHGADSCKENHFDYARAARAWGFAAIAFDQRGHGASGGELDGRAVDDLVAIATLLRPGPVALRGSSMGATLALAAAAPSRADAVVAICPAPAESLLRGLEAGRLAFSSAARFRSLLETIDLARLAGALDVPLLLMHAMGDEQVPIANSRLLADAAPSAKLIGVADGDHRSVQHDAELQGESLRFIERAFAVAARERARR